MGGTVIVEGPVPLKGCSERKRMGIPTMKTYLMSEFNSTPRPFFRYPRAESSLAWPAALLSGVPEQKKGILTADKI
jgi:hypothetical protein